MAKQTSSQTSPTPSKRKRASAAPAQATDVAAPKLTTRPPTHEEIAARALEIYRSRGDSEGNELSDWLAAERELRA